MGRAASDGTFEFVPAIRRCLARLDPGAALIGIERLTGGVSANVASVHFRTASDSVERVVFRQHPDDSFKEHGVSIVAKEFEVMTAVHAAGLAVPYPLTFDDAEGGGSGLPSMLIEWIDGTTELAADDVAVAMDQMADFLVQLHTVGRAAVDGISLESIEDPCVAIGQLLPETEAGARVRSAAELCRLPASSDLQVLLHGDYWPGNVMWRDGRLVAVLDWEDTCLGDPMADVATARVELCCRSGDEAMERFTAAYLAKSMASTNSLVTWELYVSSAALASMHRWNLTPDDELRRRRTTESFFNDAAARLP